MTASRAGAAMKERPIIFSAPMVRALLDGRKTQTRRIVGLDTLRRSDTPGYDWTFRCRAPVRSIAGQRRHSGGCWQDLSDRDFIGLCPYGVPGDRLWVRETWYCDDYTAGDLEAARRCYVGPGPSAEQIVAQWRKALEYRADHDCSTWEAGCPCRDDDGRSSWRSPLFMPRWAARIVLEIAEVRVERLQSISTLEAMAEGVEPRPNAAGVLSYTTGFHRLWDEINGDRAPWLSDPWVWAVTFSVVDDEVAP